MGSKNGKSHWLCPDGEYQKAVRQYAEIYPNLARPDPRNSKASSQNSVAVLLQLLPSQPVNRINFDKASELDLHFQTLRSDIAGNGDAAAHNVYILEGLSGDFVSIFGSHFRIDPGFFMRQERYPRLLHFDREKHRLIDTPSLPSEATPSRRLHFTYPEVRYFKELVHYNTRCKEGSRPITSIGFEGILDSIGIIVRKCGIWSQMRDGGGSDVLILVDAPVTHLTTPKIPQGIASRGEPYQGGYIDFIKPSLQESHSIRGPPRTSMLSDLCFYLQTYATSDFLKTTDSSPSPAFFVVKKLVSSHYMKLLDYLDGVVRKLRDSEWRQAGLIDYEKTGRGAAAEQWSSLHVAGHYILDFQADVEQILVQLGIPYYGPVPLPPAADAPIDVSLTDRDFLYLHSRLMGFKIRIDQMVAASLGLAGLVSSKHAMRDAELNLEEARRAIREAKDVKSLTLIAMFFIPLAFTSGLFSMSDRFMPGSDKFWVFWVVSVPLVIGVFAAAGLVRLGYDEMGVWRTERLGRVWRKGREPDKE